MPGKRTGLVELVEAARDRALARDHIERWHIEVHEWAKDYAESAKEVAREIAAEACLLCQGGQFRRARKLVAARDAYIPDHLWDLLEWVPECPTWAAFAGVVALAERIDSLLAALEPEAGPLARDCRDDLDLLGVLADWCDDAGKARAAAEARHLRRLAGVLRRC
jgi:hypothetical protein